MQILVHTRYLESLNVEFRSILVRFYNSFISTVQFNSTQIKQQTEHRYTDRCRLQWHNIWTSTGHIMKSLHRCIFLYKT